ERADHERAGNGGVRQQRDGRRRRQPAGFLHPIAKDVADGGFHQRWSGPLLMMPIVSTPAALRRSNTSISSPMVTSRSLRRKTSFFVAVSIFWRTRSRS